MKVIKFCISLLAIQSAQTLSTEKSASIVNTTGIQFTPQPPDLPFGFINATWAGCDINGSIAYCDEMVEKNQTNSSKECFEEKGCCEGDSDTGFIACPQTSGASHILYISIEAISLLTIWRILWGGGDCPQLGNPSKYGLSIGAGVMCFISSIYEFNASNNPETLQKSAVNVAISFASGLAAGCGTARLLRWFENRQRDSLTVPLNQPQPDVNPRRCC